MIAFLLSMVLPMLPSFAVKAIGMLAPAAKNISDTVINDRNAARDERLAAEVTKREEMRSIREIRLATAGFWEQRFLAFVAGLVAIAHWALIGIGTYIAAPMKAVGNDLTWLEFTLHIPNMPEPWDGYEGPILLSYFGIYAGLTIAQKFAGAYAVRGSR